MRIVLAENFRAVFYAPFYACLTLGFFRDRGLEVSLVASPSPGAGIADMMKGSTHLVWGGPLRVLKDRDSNPAGPQSLVAFGEVAARDPFFLIGRPALAPLDLRRLPELRMASVSEVPTPWICLQQDLRDSGVDPDAIPRVSDATMGDNLKALAAGELDVIQAFEPFATLAEQQGAGIPLHAAHARGFTAYTTFLSTAQNLERHDQAFRTMSEALLALRPWLDAEGGAALARAVREFYPHVELPVLERSLTRYHAAGLWTCRPEISRVGFERLALSMRASGFIDHAAPYEACVASWAQQPAGFRDDQPDGQ